MSEDYSIRETQHQQTNVEVMFYVNKRFEEQNQHISDIRLQIDASLTRIEFMFRMLMQQDSDGNA